MALNRARDEIELGGDAELALAIDEDPAVALERRDAFVEELLPASREAEPRGHFGGRERNAGVSELAQDRIAGRRAINVRFFRAIDVFIRAIAGGRARAFAWRGRGPTAKRYRF